MMLLQSEMGIIILLTDPATIIFGYVTAQPQIPAIFINMLHLECYFTHSPV